MSPVPTEWVGPAPRSPDADADARGCFDMRELHVGPIRKHRVMLDERPQPLEAIVGWQRAEKNALRVADVEHHGTLRTRRPLELLLEQFPSAGPSHFEMWCEPFRERRATRLTPAPVSMATSALADPSCCSSNAASPRTPFPDTSEAAVAIPQLHRCRRRRSAVCDQPVGANTCMTVAEFRRANAGKSSPRDICLADAGKSLPYAWGLRKSDHVVTSSRGHLRQNASRCQPYRSTSERGSALNVPTNRPL